MGRAVHGRKVGDDALDIRPSAQLLEGRMCGIQLEHCSVVVAESSAREPDELARSCDLVRRLELLPRVSGATKRRQRTVGVGFGEQYCAAGERDHAGEHRALVSLGQLLELERSVDWRPRGRRPRA